MTTGKDRLKYLIAKYADSSCTKEEMLELFAFISHSKNNANFNQEFLGIWNNLHPGDRLSAIDENELFRQIENEISSPPVRYSWISWTRAAAILVAILCAGVMYFLLTPKKLADRPKYNYSAAISQSEHKLIKLPDGSSVLLNNNSTLDFPSQFTQTNREVILNGEAYFDISRDPAHPFIIHTGKVKTMVLGTAFNIRAYPNEQHVTITVTRGKVKVETDEKLLGILNPNQQLSFNKQISAAIKHEVLADSVITWKEKDLVFDNASFEEAAEQIARRYGVQIRFAKEGMKKCRFYASFLHEDKLEQVLTVLCDLNNATYEVSNDTVIIKGEGCN
jgi:transmembrane sensor